MSTNERKLVAEAWANAVRTTKQHLMIQVGGASLPDVLELVRKRYYNSYQAKASIWDPNQLKFF